MGVDVTDASTDMPYCPVIEECAASPVAAGKADARVSEPIRNAAVIAHMPAPIASVPEVDAVGPAPVAGGPQKARLGSHNPSSGYPVIPIRSIRPVAGSPHIAITGTGRLVINRQWGRGNLNRYAHTDCRPGL